MAQDPLAEEPVALPLSAGEEEAKSTSNKDDRKDEPEPPAKNEEESQHEQSNSHEAVPQLATDPAPAVPEEQKQEVVEENNAV